VWLGLGAYVSYLTFDPLLCGRRERQRTGQRPPTIISDLYPVAVRGKVLAWFYAAIQWEVLLATCWVPGRKATGDWRWAFYLVLPPGLLLRGLVLLHA